MKELATLIGISFIIAIASIIFVIWVMYTIAKSLKEIAFQVTKIAAMMASQRAEQSRQE